jgi:DNA repair exonuclease SbcCD ATPase subunit
MARAIVTPELVEQAADALVITGEEPSIIAVQEQIGGGSYTTVKRYLEQWKAKQKQQPPIELPPEIATQGTLFIRELWANAATVAEQRSAEIRHAAQRQVGEAQAALASAEAAIARLESEAEQQAQQLASQEQQLATLRQELAEARSAAQIAEAHSNDLTQQLAELQRQAQQREAELAEARSATINQAHLTGQLEALQRQLADQSALIERLAKS